MHLPPTCTSVCLSSRVNIEICLPDSLKMSSRSVRRTCRGCLHFSVSLAAWRHTPTWPGSQGICSNVIFIAAAIILWDYPCQVNLELEFYICAGSRCQYEPLANHRNFYTLQDGCAVVVRTSLPLPTFIRTWPSR